MCVLGRFHRAKGRPMTLKQRQICEWQVASAPASSPAMNPLFDAYYYGEENTDVQGPSPLEAIAARVKSGDVPEWVMLSRIPSGPWVPLRLVQHLGAEAFAQPKPKSLKKSESPPSKPVSLQSTVTRERTPTVQKRRREL